MLVALSVLPLAGCLGGSPGSGGCGAGCTLPHATAACVAGICEVMACEEDAAGSPLFYDCDIEAPGCETSRTPTCGACGTECGQGERCEGVRCACGEALGEPAGGAVCGEGESCVEGACRCGDGEACGETERCCDGACVGDDPGDLGLASYGARAAICHLPQAT